METIVSNIKKNLRKSKNKEILKDLKNSYQNKECLLVGCGPSLAKLSRKKIHDFSRGKCIFAVKQAYKYMGMADFHFLNDNNIADYNHSQDTLVVSENCQNVRCPALELLSDLHFLVLQNWDFDKSLSARRNFDDWTLDKQSLVRPFGPGILSELVLFFVEHLGFAKLYSVGVDLGPSGQQQRQHFYQENIKNPAHHMKVEESDGEVHLMRAFYNWFKEKNIEWFVISPDSYLPEEIPRYLVI